MDRRVMISSLSSVVLLSFTGARAYLPFDEDADSANQSIRDLQMEEDVAEGDRPVPVGRAEEQAGNNGGTLADLEDGDFSGKTRFDVLDFEALAELASDSDEAKEPDRITEVVLRFPYNNDKFPFGPCVIRCQDRRLLTLVFREIRRWGAARIVLSHADMTGGWVVHEFGWLDVHTESAKYRLKLSRLGFTLNNGGGTGEVFFSPALASFCEDLVVIATGEHMAQEIGDALSGLKWLNSHQAQYRKLTSLRRVVASEAEQYSPND